MTAITIRSAAAGDRDSVIGVVVLAFSTDPPARWMFPDPAQFITHFPNFTRAFGGAAFDHQTADHTEGFGGAALWLPPGVQPDEEALAALLERAVAPARLPHVFEILEKLATYHPAEPHWYLPMIGVDPAKQGNGYGSTLLRHALQRVDRDHLPAYLESTNPSNIPLYERHGFEVLGTINVADAPPLFPMLRTAR